MRGDGAVVFPIIRKEEGKENDFEWDLFRGQPGYKLGKERDLKKVDELDEVWCSAHA